MKTRSRWSSETTPYVGGTNESGFTGLPGGYSDFSGTFVKIGMETYWWAATQFNSLGAIYRGLDSRFNMVDRSNNDKKYGLSVRCLRD
jgi:uncharacterized protein (TIGR02145 family)